jgi:hypothetical protein
MQQPEITLDELGLTTKGPSQTQEVSTPKRTPTVPSRPTAPVRAAVTAKKTPIAKQPPKTPIFSTTKKTPVTRPVKKVLSPPRRHAVVQQPRREIVEDSSTQENVEEQYEEAISKARQSKSITHVYGSTYTNKAEVMCSKILSQYPNEKILLVCPSSEEASRIHNNTKKERKISSGLITSKSSSYDFNTNSIICTDSTNARAFVNNMKTNKKTSKEDLAWVIINAFDYEDANATIVCGLLSDFDCSVMVMSISVSSYIPDGDYTDLRTQIPLPSVTIKYIDLNEMNRIKSVATVYTQLYSKSTDKSSNDKVVSVGINPYYNKNTKAIIDNTYISERGGTQLKHDIIADCISEGVVYRVCSINDHYGLRSHKPLEINTKALKGDALKYFTSHNATDLERKAMKDIKSFNFQRQGSLFYVRYVATRGKGCTARDHYCAGLVANLISMKLDSFASETLSDEAKQNLFTPFLGRNDIETLTNVWSSILLTCEDNLYYKWNTRNNSFVDWCKIWGFDVTVMGTLWSNMSILAHNSPNLTFKDFKDITTKELNLISKVLVTVLDPLPRNSKVSTIKDKFGEQDLVGAYELMKGNSYSLIIKSTKFVEGNIGSEDFNDL